MESLLPPIIVSPVDPECRLSKEQCEEIEKRIRNADDGDVICLPVPIEMHVLTGGYWIKTDQLSEFHTPVTSPKTDKQETTFDPLKQ